MLTLVENPLSQTLHLNGRSLVWDRMWISSAELQANTLKQIWHVVFPRAARSMEKRSAIINLMCQSILVRLMIKYYPVSRSKHKMMLPISLQSDCNQHPVNYVSLLFSTLRKWGKVYAVEAVASEMITTAFYVNNRDTFTYVVCQEYSETVTRADWSLDV